ncbi:MAG: V-type ATP synthase subunit E [Eubacteriaceae bacterium]|nr:V-type ATP synthase subunit E [Eubacteriaceae bacterium]
MSIEKIISKITDDARKEAEEEMLQAVREAEAITKSAREKAEEKTARAEKDGQRDKVKQLESRRAVAAIDGRNIILEQKQKIIDECFDSAMKKVAEPGDRDEYLEFLSGTVRASGLTEGEIILNKKDMEELGDKLTAKLKDGATGGGFTVSKETADIIGGLMIRKGSTWYNASIEAIAKEIRNDLTAEIAAVLFGDQEDQNGSQK